MDKKEWTLPQAINACSNYGTGNLIHMLNLLSGHLSNIFKLLFISITFAEHTTFKIKAKTQSLKNKNISLMVIDL